MLPVAIILIFFFTAAIIKFVKSNGFAKQITIAAHLVALGLCAILLSVVADGNSVSFVIGTAPWNFHVSAGPLDAYTITIFVGIGLLIVWASTSMIDQDLEEKWIRLYYILVCILIATLCGIVVFENFFNIFFMMEFSSFAAAGIVIIKNKRENMQAGMKYLTLSILGSSLILMGIIILHYLTGHLDLSGIQQELAVNVYSNEQMVRNAVIFITLGTALKAALFPLHIWLPDAHSTAPSPSSALLSALVLKAYVVLYVKVLFGVVGIEFIMNDEILSLLMYVVMIVGAMAMLAGSLMALLQSDLKRMIAYSSVAQIGYIFLGIGMGTEYGLFAALFHIMAHATTKALLFLVAGSIIGQTHNREIINMGGIGVKMRISMGMFTIGALSMVGIPLFVGFNSKWFFAVSMTDSGHFWLLGILALSALLNGCYYLPIVVRGFFGKDAQDAIASGESLERPIKELLPIIVLAVLVIALAIFGTPINAYIYGAIDAWFI